jgi:hypothetical protein
MQKPKTIPGWEVAEVPLGWLIFRHGKKTAHTYTGLGKEEGRFIAQRIVSAPVPQAALDEALKERTVQLF